MKWWGSPVNTPDIEVPSHIGGHPKSNLDRKSQNIENETIYGGMLQFGDMAYSI